MSFDLCQVRQAKKPYCIETINTQIWSIEELCFYLYENIYLIDRSIMNEYLCDWIRDELDLKRLYKVLYEQLDAAGGICSFILPIFREIGYLTPAKMREYTDRLGRLDAQPVDMKQKLKGDYLVRCEMFESAINEYSQILDRQGPGSLGAQFYAQVQNNLGCAYARLFRFQEAAECFLKAWKMTETKEMIRRYASVLPLFLSGDAYEERLKELGADEFVISRIQDYNIKIAHSAQEAAKERRRSVSGTSQLLEELKEDYRRSARH